ncbi:MAG TPA: hypothetical protein PKI99_06380, partial [Terrimesophilobacter sp.]|nr:hypothetical protein [Terrimesophilobacter sp.]
MKDSRRHAAIWSLALIPVAILSAAMAVAVAAARTIIVPPRSRIEDTRIAAFDRAAGTITFSRSPDSIVDGRYSFWFSDGTGHARVGGILSETADTVTRELLAVDFGDL